MLREIRKKLVILGNRKPFKKETMELVIDLQKKNWLAMNMRLEGRQITEKDLDDILAGGLPNLLVDDYVALRDLEWLYDKMILWQKDDYRLTSAMLNHMYQVISGEESTEYRKSASAILEWSYTPRPMSPLDISRGIDEITDYEYERSYDPVAQAIKIHNQILRLMPYKAFNQIIARAAMLYYLMSREMPLVSFSLKEEEYNEILSRELAHPNFETRSLTGKKIDEETIEHSDLYEPLAKGILDTLGLIDTLTCEY